MEADFEAAYLHTMRAAWMADNGKPNSMEASMAKAKAGRVGSAVTLVPTTTPYAAALELRALSTSASSVALSGNTGSRGALFDTPIINQPQVAILGTGTIVKRPMVIQDADGNDVVAIRHMCYLSLTYDHRIVDGADAGRFLQGLKARLEEGRFEGSLGL